MDSFLCEEHLQFVTKIGAIGNDWMQARAQPKYSSDVNQRKKSFLLLNVVLWREKKSKAGRA